MVEDFVESVHDKKRVKDQLGDADTVKLAVSKWKTEKLTIYNMRIRVSEVGIGTAFILGHSTNAQLGNDTLGAGTLGTWKVVSETSGAEQITDVGKEEVIKWLKGETATHFTHTAIGSGTTDFNVSQTVLVTEHNRKENFTGSPIE